MQSNFILAPADYRSLAERAVITYVNNKYKGFFTQTDIEDIVSDVVKNMWRSRDHYDSTKGEPFKWVWSIAKNAVRDAYDYKKNRGDISVSADDTAVNPLYTNTTYRSEEFEADYDISYEQTRQDLLSRVDTDREKQALSLMMDGYDVDGMAAEMGLSKDTVYSLRYEIKRKLRVSLRNSDQLQ